MANMADLGSPLLELHTMSLDAERIEASSPTKGIGAVQAETPSPQGAEKKKTPCPFCVGIFDDVTTSRPQAHKSILCGIDRLNDFV